MWAARPIGCQSHEATDRGKRDEPDAARKETRIETGFGDEIVEISAEFDQDNLGRLYGVDMNEARRGSLVERARELG
jgi:hypothetical protein